MNKVQSSLMYYSDDYEASKSTGSNRIVRWKRISLKLFFFEDSCKELLELIFVIFCELCYINVEYGHQS